MKTLIVLLLAIGQASMAQTKDGNEETKKGVVENLRDICWSGSNKNLIVEKKEINKILIQDCKTKEKDETKKVQSILEFGFPNFKLDYRETDTEYLKKYALSFISSINESAFRNIIDNGITLVNTKEITFTDGKKDLAAFTIKDVDQYDANFVLVKVQFSHPVDIKAVYDKCIDNSNETAVLIFSAYEMYYIIPTQRFEEFKKNLYFLKTYYMHKQKEDPKWIDPK